MKKHLLAGLAVVLVVGISASAAMAQCAFEHPKKANKFSSTFVQAFVSCNNAGGNASNTTTEGGVMSCKPPETFNQQAGTPVDGWQWDELKGQGQVQFKAQKLAKPPITPADSTDLKVKAKLKGVVDALGGAASGTGGLATVARATFNDRMNGDLTVIDFPATFAFTLADGKGQVKTTADALLNGISQPGLPHCTSIEVVSIMVLDKNGNAFANVGTFNP